MSASRAAAARPAKPAKARRLDAELVAQGLFTTVDEAARAVMAGQVAVDGRRVDKPGTPVAADAPLAVAGQREPFASRAGRKLDAALEVLTARYPELAVHSAVALDVGASTGGFTDCLLQRGAARVYALDVGYGLLADRLRQDPRVVVMERLNARHLAPGDLPEASDLVTLDLSFISLTKVVPAVVLHLKPGGFLLALVKPQFEAARGEVGLGGIVRDEEVRSRVVATTARRLGELGLELLAVIDSALPGSGGNREAFALLRRPLAAPQPPGDPR